MTTVSIAVLLLALLAFLAWRKHLAAAWALLALFAGLYAAQTSWLGPHLLAAGEWFFRNLSHIHL
jgi:apolipoprotein N-acyltransferase